MITYWGRSEGIYIIYTFIICVLFSLFMLKFCYKYKIIKPDLVDNHGLSSVKTMLRFVPQNQG